jgi:hypothetical protein
MAKILVESPLFEMKDATTSIDLGAAFSRAAQDERLSETKWWKASTRSTSNLPLQLPEKLERHYSKNPFIPEQEAIDLKRVALILKMQAMGLVKRLETIHCSQKAIVGIVRRT